MTARIKQCGHKTQNLENLKKSGWMARQEQKHDSVWSCLSCLNTLTFLAQNEAMAVQRSVGVANQPLEPALLLLSPPGKPAKMQSSSQWQGSLKASEASKALGVSRPCSSQVNRKSIPVNHFESQSPVKSAESVLRALLHRRWYRLCTPQFCKAFRGDLLFKMACKEVQGMLQFVQCAHWIWIWIDRSHVPCRRPFVPNQSQCSKQRRWVPG